MAQPVPVIFSEALNVRDADIESTRLGPDHLLLCMVFLLVHQKLERACMRWKVLVDVHSVNSFVPIESS